MREALGNTAGRVMAVLAALSALVTILGWSIPTLRDWLGRHAWLGWTLAGTLLVAGCVWHLIDAAAIRNLAEERHALQGERDDLLKRLHPTAHDVDLFDRLMRHFPWEAGVMFWLENGFTAKAWRGSQSHPLYIFNDAWAHTYFDDEVVQAAYGIFRDATAELGLWLATAGGPVAEDGGAGTRYAITDGHHLPGGWEAYDELRKVGMAHAHEVMRQRKEFERVGRIRGLRTPMD